MDLGLRGVGDGCIGGNDRERRLRRRIDVEALRRILVFLLLQRLSPLRLRDNANGLLQSLKQLVQVGVYVVVEIDSRGCEAFEHRCENELRCSDYDGRDEGCYLERREDVRGCYEGGF